MTAEEDARRLAAGPPPSDLVELGRRGPRASADRADPPHDPLQLCIFATIALLGWVLGPVALVVLAGVAFVGYWRARRAGLARSRCFLRDTRLVLLYLGALVVAGGVGAYLVAASLLGA